LAPEEPTLSVPSPPRSRSPGGRHLTAWSLAALVLGLGLGIALHGSPAPWVGTLANSLKPIGRVWILALQYAVVPLVVTQAFAAVLKTERLGALGARTVGLFLVLLAAGAAFTLLIAPPLVTLYPVDPATVSALRSGISVPESLRDALGSGTTLGDWLRGYLPTSVSRLLRGGNLLIVLLSAMVLALFARRFARRGRERFQRRAQTVADAAVRIVGWILLFSPVGVLALSFGLALSAGGNAVGLMLFFVVLVSALLLLFTGLLYPLTAVLSGISLRRFGRGVAPAQLVAVSTRSSLASLPALIEGGRDRLGLPIAATGFVLPLAVSTFKPSMVISHPVMLLFVAHAFGVSLGTNQLLLFVATIVLFSFGVPGIPGGAPGVSTLPIFLAAGVPLEGVLLLDVVEAIPDIFKTITNVTADLSVATIVTRRSRASPVA
jgi:Na+/H+-dicarboxylate symporter